MPIPALVVAPPWRDRRGRFSPLKAACLGLLILPAAWLLGAFWAGELGAEPIERLQDEAGLFALRFLFLSLLITPLRLLWRRNELIELRRMIGLAALIYALGHFVCYMALQDWVALKIASEIVLRAYLLIGATALLALVALGATSTDGAVRWLGAARWQALHRLAYPAALLATVHLFWQTRLNPTEALAMSGLLAWLLVFRLWRWQLWHWRAKAVGPSTALLLALGVTSATALGEALLFHLRFGAELGLILATNFTVDAGVRPAWWVAGPTGLVAAGAQIAARTPKRANGRVPKKHLRPAGSVPSDTARPTAQLRQGP